MPSGVQIRRAAPQDELDVTTPHFWRYTLSRVEAIIAARDRGAVSGAIREFTTEQHPGAL